MFHDDARVNMLAGFLEDGHNIKGKEHLGECLAKLGGEGSDNEEEGEEKSVRSLLFAGPSYQVTAFEDYD